MDVVKYIIYLVPYDLHSCVIICHPNMLHHLMESIPTTQATFTTEYEDDDKGMKQSSDWPCAYSNM